jgi:FAD synthetase
VQDGNAFFMAQELWSHGVKLCKISVIADSVDEIAEEVRKFSDRFDYVFTSGGIGPTHDDITIEGISKAFNVRTVIDPTLKRVLETRQGTLSPAQLRMAEVPEGAELFNDDSLSFPLIKFRNVFIFPGIPQLLRKKFIALEKVFHEPVIYLKKIYVNESETRIAPVLNKIVKRYQKVKIGSYPIMENKDYSVMITLESLDASSLSSAYMSLLEDIPADKLFKAEG